MNSKTVIPPMRVRNFVAKNAIKSGAGKHVDRKRQQKNGREKHKRSDRLITEY